MADGSFPTLISKDRMVNAVDDAIWVVLSDGSAAVSVTGNKLDVNADFGSDVDIRAIVAGTSTGGDNIGIMANTVKDGTAGTFYYPLVDSDGQLQVDVLTAPAVRTITKASDSIQVSKDTNANAETNPIFVTVVNQVASGKEVHYFDTEEDVAVDTPYNVDYPTANAIMFVKSVIVGASGGVKFEVWTGPVGTLVEKAVGFIPRQGGVAQLFFDPPIEVPVGSTGTTRIRITNRQGSIMDVYGTIIGSDV